MIGGKSKRIHPDLIKEINKIKANLERQGIFTTDVECSRLLAQMVNKKNNQKSKEKSREQSQDFNFKL